MRYATLLFFHRLSATASNGMRFLFTTDFRKILFFLQTDFISVMHRGFLAALHLPAYC